jgi:predicted DNA-binding protein (MmcQ/YjbR family)
MSTRDAKKRITEAVTSWGEITLAPHRFGGTAFMLGKRELGHIHGDRLIDIPFPKSVRDELVSSGQAEPHHILPNSGWISFFLRTEADIDHAIKLMRTSFELAATREKGARE